LGDAKNVSFIKKLASAKLFEQGLARRIHRVVPQKILQPSLGLAQLGGGFFKGR